MIQSHLRMTKFNLHVKSMYYQYMKDIVNSDISSLKGKTGFLLFYFTASWCGPCQRIKPLIQGISDGVDESHLEIYRVDLDMNESLVAELKIRSVPTFYLFKGKDLVDQCSGADISKVHAMLKRHLP